MTEFEVAILREEVGANILALSDGIASHIAIYLTLVSAYLVVAFMAGNKLSRVQVSIATALYSLAYLFESLVVLGYFRTLARTLDYYQTLNPAIPVGFIADIGSGYLGLTIIMFVYVASIWFMWNVRASRKL